MNGDALKWVLRLGVVSDKLASWRLRLMEFDFNVVGRAFMMNQDDDALSITKTVCTDISELDEGLPEKMVS